MQVQERTSEGEILPKPLAGEEVEGNIKRISQDRQKPFGATTTDWRELTFLLQCCRSTGCEVNGRPGRFKTIFATVC